MPKLFDLLSDDSNKDHLSKLQKKAWHKKKKTHKRPQSRPGSPTTRSFPIPNFVSVDLETTGLDKKNDRIMEIGAVKFINGHETESYATFVNPGIAIPEPITELTGISSEHTAAAPEFKSVVDDFLDFIGHLPICGHHIEFDIAFLNEALVRLGRDKLQNNSLDSAQMSRVALLNMPGYTLGQVAAHLNIPLDNAHRALNDAKVAGLVAVALIPRVYDIPKDIRQIMVGFAPHSLFKKILLQSLNRSDDHPRNKAAKPKKIFHKLEAYENATPIEQTTIEAFFSDHGELSRHIGDFAPRASQTQMATAVASALNQEHVLVAEAGTGTGKSLAYLLPSAHFALQNNCRIIISTYTRNLQDQLAGKDLPLVQSIVGPELKYSVLKGRGNYLCQSRYKRLLAGALGNLSIRDRAGLLPLIRWAEQTATGDIEEQRQFNPRWHAKIWHMISADSHECQGYRCSMQDTCYLQKARNQAQSSHIVIINHSLFFSDICSETSFLKHTGPLIFDEAHHLESVGHQILRTIVDTNRFNQFQESGLDTTTKLEKATTHSDLKTSVKELKKTLKRLRKNSSSFLSDIGSLGAQHSQGQSRYQIAVRDKPFAHFSSLAGVTLALKDLQDQTLSLMQKAEELQDEISDTFLITDLQAFERKLTQLKADLEYLTTAITEDHVFWLEGDRQKGWAKICGVPLDIGTVLTPFWDSHAGCSIFTSATISVSESMDFFKRKIGLDRVKEKEVCDEIYTSPFQHNQALQGALTESPELDQEEFIPFVAESIETIHGQFEKNMLVLFTSNAMLESVQKSLAASEKIPRNKLLYQGIGTNRHHLLEQFKSEKHMVLLGSASFWEGIDAPGESCEIVLIPRLPFQVPTDPLTEALSRAAEKRHGESFFSFSVPEAIIRLRQGAGRLIRTAGDRGVLLILDKRIVQKNYGKAFVKSLGNTVTPFPTTKDFCSAAKEFFESSPHDHETVRYIPLDEA